MAIYNPKSMHADEFINDEEIQETLRYAEENKNNVELIDSLLEKARPRHTATGTVCAGDCGRWRTIRTNFHSEIPI